MAISGLGVVSLVPAATMQSEEAPPARSCECGRIESAVDIPATDNRAIRIREYTVRMADGSRRTFTERSDVRWRIGESLTLIGGDRVPAGHDPRTQPASRTDAIGPCSSITPNDG